MRIDDFDLEEKMKECRDGDLYLPCYAIGKPINADPDQLRMVKSACEAYLKICYGEAYKQDLVKAVHIDKVKWSLKLSKD